MILLWFKAFLLTLALESPLVVVLLRKEEPSRARLAALAFFANLSTHPIVWFVIPAVVNPPSVAFWVSEMIAFLLEAMFYRLVLPQVSWLKACLTSALSNALSAATGWLLFHFAAHWLLD